MNTKFKVLDSIDFGNGFISNESCACILPVQVDFAKMKIAIRVQMYKNKEFCDSIEGNIVSPVSLRSNLIKSASVNITEAEVNDLYNKVVSSAKSLFTQTEDY